ELNRFVMQGHVQEMTDKYAEKIKNIQDERLGRGIDICMVTRAQSRASKQGENITNETENEVIPNPTVIEELEIIEEEEKNPIESQVDIVIPTAGEEFIDEPEFGKMVYQITGGEENFRMLQEECDELKTIIVFMQTENL